MESKYITIMWLTENYSSRHFKVRSNSLVLSTELATVKRLETDVSSVSPSSERIEEKGERSNNSSILPSMGFKTANENL